MYESALIKTISLPGLTNRTKSKKKAKLIISGIWIVDLLLESSQEIHQALGRKKCKFKFKSNLDICQHYERVSCLVLLTTYIVDHHLKTPLGFLVVIASNLVEGLASQISQYLQSVSPRE